MPDQMNAINTKASNNVIFNNHHLGDSDSRQEIVAGLHQPQKTLNPKFFYDTHGSELFELITQQPEYYPTRTERWILEHYAHEIAAMCGQDCVLIEPGSGSSEKVRLLLPAIQPKTYVPMDIAAEFLYRAALKLGEEFAWLNVHAICADFGRHKHSPTGLPSGKRVIFYPGSTLGNMSPEQAKGFLQTLRSWINADDGGVLIGIDLHKSEVRLNAAYNDSQGITEAFNLNILSHINRLMKANFELNNFSHHAFFNHELSRIEMHLVSELDHIVRIDESAIAFSKGETIHTENSYKYTLESFQDLVESAGLSISKTWCDKDQLFSVHYLESI